MHARSWYLQHGTGDGGGSQYPCQRKSAAGEQPWIQVLMHVLSQRKESGVVPARAHAERG